MKVLFLFAALLIESHVLGQGYISYDYMSESKLHDELGNEYGSGSMQIISGAYSLPLSLKKNDNNQPVVWMASLYGAYGILTNQGMATDLNPDNILNASLNITHLRPLSKKWSFMASAGCGVYAPVQEIGFKSLLANGGVVFIYKLNKNMDIGIGAGVTNSYGIPMVMPMLYLSWQRAGKYEFKIDMSSGLKMAVSTRLNQAIRLELTALEMNGMTAVIKVNGKSKIYSNIMLNSTFNASFHFSKKVSLYMGVGGNWVRGISWSDRSLKGFVDGFKDDGNDEPEFRPALRLTSGLRYTF